MMFHTADQTHVWHLQTTSYAMHGALNAYYDGIRCQLDRFAEACIGYKGVRLRAVGKMPLKDFSNDGQVMDHLRVVCKYCNGLYDELNKEEGAQHLLAIIDDIKELIGKTKYLLTLK